MFFDQATVNGAFFTMEECWVLVKMTLHLPSAFNYKIVLIAIDSCTNESYTKILPHLMGYDANK